jgi:uncharacterized protein YndB with AHSA1/START domain
MRIVLRALGLLLLLLLGFMAYVAVQPAQFEVTRSITIAAPPETVFAEINDFHSWPAWSPWAKLDPEMTTGFAGPSTGLGARYSWSGNDKVGEGRMEVVESHPNDRIVVRIDFARPMANTAMSEFTFKPNSAGTGVTWTMTEQDGFFGKAARIVFHLGKLIGADFERGLAQLKSTVEGKA